MNTNVAKPSKVAIIGASGTYDQGILARAEEINVERVGQANSARQFLAAAQDKIGSRRSPGSLVLSPKLLQAAWVRRRLSAK